MPFYIKKRRKLFGNLLLTVVIVIGLVIYWNSLYSNVIVYSPSSGSTVSTYFTVSGEVPISWINGPGIGIDVQDKNGYSIDNQLATVTKPWWSWFLTTRVPFHALIDTSGMTEKGVYEGPATIVIYRLYSNSPSYSIPVNLKSN